MRHLVDIMMVFATTGVSAIVTMNPGVWKMSNMTPDEISNLIAAIATVAAVIVALIIAIFQDRMRTWFMRPKLDVSIDLCPPDCHKTQLHLLPMSGKGANAALPVPSSTTQLSPNEGTGDVPSTVSPSSLATGTMSSSSSSRARSAGHGAWPVPILTADVYYFRLRIQNSGRQKAESIEVFAAKLEKRRADGTFGPVDSFLPMNLLWSHYRQVFLPAISPETYKHCDLAHIIDPEERKSFPGEHRTWDNIPSESTLLSFDTVAKPYTQSYLVPMGTYRLKIVVAAANAGVVKKTLEITLTGDWYNDEQEMLGQGVGITILH